MKKALTIALALCMVLALAACGGGVADATPTPNYDGSTPTDLLGPSPSPTPVHDPEPVDELIINGVHLVRGGELTGVGYSGFDYADGVLTVSDVTVQGTGGVITVSGGDLEIVVSGEVTLAGEGASAIRGDDSDITITGDGTLNVSATDAAAIDLSGSLSVGCALTAVGDPACSSESVSALEGFAITVNDGANLTVAAA